MRRLLPLFLLVPTLLLVACSDDGEPASPGNGNDTPVAQATEPPATGAEAPASPGVVEGTVVIDFTGSPQEREKVEAPFSVDGGSTAWDAVQAALAEEDLGYQDFGGDLGIFVTGFYGVEAQGNHFWEFRVNGEGATVGVSQYEVQPGDVVEFVYSSF